MEQARQLVNGYDVELWQYDRKIAKFDHKPELRPYRLNYCAAPSYLKKECRAMDQNSDRKELERRLEQAKRMAAGPSDPLTKERLKKLVEDLEGQLREPK